MSLFSWLLSYPRYLFICWHSAITHKSSAFWFSLWERRTAEISMRPRPQWPWRNVPGRSSDCCYNIQNFAGVNSYLLGIEKTLLPEPVRGIKLFNLPKNSSSILSDITCVLLVHVDYFISFYLNFSSQNTIRQFILVGEHKP